MMYNDNNHFPVFFFKIVLRKRKVQKIIIILIYGYYFTHQKARKPLPSKGYNDNNHYLPPIAILDNVNYIVFSTRY